MSTLAAPSTLDEQVAFFAKNDYVLFPSVLTRAEVDQANAVIDDHRKKWPNFWGTGARSQAAQCLMGMPELDYLIRHPSFMPLAQAIIPNIVFSEHSIMIREGNQKPGVEGWHRDTSPNPKNKYGVTALSMIYYLTDVDETTARYCLIPGSHLVEKAPEKIAPDSIHYENEVEMFAPAGSVILVNSGIWHCGKWGTGPRERRTLHLYMQPQDKWQFSEHTIFPRRLWDVPDPEQRRFYSHFNRLTQAVVESYVK
ncbi:MAG: phytanoyl-CoA dioxygenase family protein [Planctomycetota bacterium]|nr:phytanoyl-CoA dioxygenase family protein [Planctomycetota bacterium]